MKYLVCAALLLMSIQLVLAQGQTTASLTETFASTGGKSPASVAPSADPSRSAAESATQRRETEKQGQVLVAKIEDESIYPVTARFMMDSIGEAENRNVPLILQMDTPGGLLQPTRELVKRILASKVPVITYVYPNGSRAASAGVFITYASHLAAMAPSTNIGAAHIVDVFGRWKRSINEGKTSETLTSPVPSLSPEGDDEVMNEKLMNDTLAWIEGIAHLRGRNADWARLAVTKSESITADEAVRLHVVDFVSPDIQDLLRKADGRTVAVQGGTYTLHTLNATPVFLELSLRQRMLNVLANPNVAYLLLLLGFTGLVYEITHPGLLAPGIAGAVCLLLAAFALQMLPTNYVAILLLMAGIGMIVAEIKVTSYGLLTLGGAICLFIGSLALFNQPGPFIGVSLSVIITVVGATVGLLVLLVILVVRTHHLPPAVGASTYIGEVAEVARALSPEGKVFFNGTYWDAVSTIRVPRGAKVRIVAVDKLRLLVEPL